MSGRHSFHVDLSWLGLTPQRLYLETIIIFWTMLRNRKPSEVQGATLRETPNLPFLTPFEQKTPSNTTHCEWYWHKFGFALERKKPKDHHVQGEHVSKVPPCYWGRPSVRNEPPVHKSKVEALTQDWISGTLTSLGSRQDQYCQPASEFAESVRALRLPVPRPRRTCLDHHRDCLLFSTFPGNHRPYCPPRLTYLWWHRL